MKRAHPLIQQAIYILLVLSVLLSPGGRLYAFTRDIYDAIAAVQKGDASDQQKALLFSRNDAVNAMRVKQIISQEAYQAAQEVYAEKSRELATQAAEANGAKLRVQERVPGSPYDAGTDSDYITDAKSAKQVKKIRDTYNRKVQEYLKDKGVQTAGDQNWVKRHDVDFMADPAGVSKSEFEKIAKANNDAYKNREAASFEAKYRARKETPTIGEALKYNDEMRGFIDKKTRQIEKKSQELQQLMGERDTRSPDSGGKDPEAFIERQKLEAAIQVKQAQKAKYFERMQNANAVLAGHAGVAAPDSSGLPGQAKVRALPTGQGSPLHRQISSALADSATGHLKAQSATNEARMLGVLAGRDPANARQYEDRIVEVTKDLPMSQKGEVIQLLRENPRVSDDLVRDVVKKMKPDAGAMKTGALQGGAPALHRAGDVAGMIGDIMSIDEQWKKAEQGDHLFFNMEAGDSTTVKNLKRAAIAAIELSPVPIIDSLERGWKVDEKIKRQMLEDIRKGKSTSPYQAVARLFAEVSIDTVGTMTIQPVFSGLDALREGKHTASDMWQNWQDDAIREAAYKEQSKKYDDILARISIIRLGAVNGVRLSASGEKRYDLGKVEPEETLSFDIPRTETWTDQYEARWEVLDSQKRAVLRSAGVPATDPSANTYRFAAALPSGSYTAVFRMFDKTSNRQMDASEKPFVIGNVLSFGRLAATRNDPKGQSFTGEAVVGDLLVFRVDRLGKWDEGHAVEWLVNGESHKKVPAAMPDSHQFKKRFSDIYDPGSYTVAVRAIDAKTGKIVAHQQVQFVLRASAPDATLKIRASRILLGDQAGHYAITVPDEFEPPFSVRVGGDGLEVSPSSDPLRGSIRGTASSSDSSHTVSFKLTDAKGRTARGKTRVMVRGLDPRTLASRNSPKPTLYAAPPRQAADERPGPDDSGEDFSNKISDIMNTYAKDKQRIQNESAARKNAINQAYSAPRQKSAASTGGYSTGASRAAGSPAASRFVDVTQYIIKFEEMTAYGRKSQAEYAFDRPVNDMGDRFDRPFQLQGKTVYTTRYGAIRLEKLMNKSGMKMTVREQKQAMGRSLLIQ